MAERNEAIYRVGVKNDASPELQQIAHDLQRTDEAAQAAAQAGDQRTATMVRQRGELEALTRVQGQYEQAQREGLQLDERAERAATERRQEIDRLTREIAQQEDAEARLNRQMREGVAAHRELDDQAQKVNQTTRLFNSLTEDAIQNIAGMATGIAAGGGVVTAYQQWIENIQKVNTYLKEQGDLVRENAEARLDFVALRGVEDPAVVARLDQLAAASGRRPGEVYRAAAVFESQFPSATPEQIDQLIAGTARAGRLTTAPLNTLGGALSILFRETGDVAQSENIFQEAIEQAGEADPGRLATEIGKFVGIGRTVGGLSPAEATGFAAAATGLGIPNEIANTGLRNLILALRGSEKPEASRVLEGAGVDRDAPILVALKQVSDAVQRGDLSPGDLETVFSREGLGVAAALADPVKLTNFTGSVLSVIRASQLDTSIATQKAEDLFTPGSIQALNLQSKQAESRSESVRSSSTRVARQAAARAELDLLLTELIASGELSPDQAERIKDEFGAQLGQGRTVERAASVLDRVPTADPGFPFVVRNPLTGDLATPLNPSRGVENLGVAGPIESALLERLNRGPQIQINNYGGSVNTRDATTGGVAEELREEAYR